MMTTGMPAPTASSTGATSALLSSGASTMAETFRPMKFSTTWICCSRSSSRSGPFQMIVTSIPSAAQLALGLDGAGVDGLPVLVGRPLGDDGDPKRGLGSLGDGGEGQDHPEGQSGKGQAGEGAHGKG